MCPSVSEGYSLGQYLQVILKNCCPCFCGEDSTCGPGLSQLLADVN